MLGGVQRATVSLVVIMIEGTGNVHGILPVVISTVSQVPHKTVDLIFQLVIVKSAVNFVRVLTKS